MVDVYYIEPHKFWVGLADSRNRYWNALGIGNPFRDDHSIVAEINPPKEGINRRISGAFVRDQNGRVYLAHRGRVGGGRKGIGKRAFLSWYEGSIEWIEDGDRVNEMIVVGALDDPQFVEKLGAFAKIVSIFKEEAVSGRLHSTR
jgi:5-methylcytosine-specific restriction protein A